MSDAEFRVFPIQTDDGLTLYGRDYGTGSIHLPPVVCLPGLSRNSRDFHQFASRLASEGRRVIALDYRGRGLSNWDDNKDNYNIIREAQDVVQMLDQRKIERAAFVGTSRGGLILHILGAMIGNRISAIVLNDIGPVIESEGLKRIRDYLSARNELRNLSDAVENLKAIHSDEFPAITDDDWADMAAAIYREIDGTLTSDFDPALTVPLVKMDFSAPMPDLWAQYDLLSAIPMLIIRGENSKLLSEATVSAMLARHANAKAIVAAGQGHAPLLHKDDLYRPIADFLSS